MSFIKKFFKVDKEPKPPLPCDICGRDIAKKNPWVEVRLCPNCERVICNSCSRNLKRGRCDRCNQKTIKTTRILSYPPNWKRAQSVSQTTKLPKVPIVYSEKILYCRFCGGEIKKGITICPMCGTEIESK